ncbi:lipopolysaccharide biosynthesis protein [Parafrigoribacterium soli]|uniref:lipopolysaccharide biosynthesis protein n=1 Tax=Parafrigoribacterium soli TaxID=3144663 RepID=UPI0032EEFEC6
MLYAVVWSLQIVASIIVSPVLTHVISRAEFGSLATAIAVHQVVSVLAVLGIDKAVVLQRSEDSDGGTARGLVAVGIAISLLVTLVSVATIPLWEDALGFASLHTLLLAVMLWTAPTAAVLVIEALLLTEDRFRPFAAVGLIAAVGGQLLGLILLFTVRQDPTVYAWGGVVAQFAAMAIGIVATRPSLRGLINWPVTKRAITLGIPLAFASLSWILLSAGDRVIIQIIQGPDEVARYQIAYIVGSVVITLLTFTHGAWSPHFAALRTDRERSELASRSRDQLYRLLLPTIIGVTLASPTILRVVAPASFKPGPLTLVVFLVALSAFPVAAELATAQILIVQRRGNTIGILTAIAVVFNIALNIVLVPLIGVVGAAFATVAAFGLLAFLQLRALPRELQCKRSPTRLIVGIGLCTLIAAGSILLPQTQLWNLIRFIAAVSCLPWFFWSFNRARRGLQSAPVKPAK